METGKETQESSEAVNVSLREQLLVEIETARMRHAWAKDEVKHGEPSAALVKYLQD